MSATIIVKGTDGLFRKIFLNHDGRPMHAGRMLLNHYNDHDSANVLVARGNLSHLAASVECPEGHTFETPVPGYSVYYERDRGERGQRATVYSTLRAAQEESEVYEYVWDGECWRFDGLKISV